MITEEQYLKALETIRAYKAQFSDTIEGAMLLYKMKAFDEVVAFILERSNFELTDIDFQVSRGHLEISVQRPDRYLPVALPASEVLDILKVKDTFTQQDYFNLLN